MQRICAWCKKIMGEKDGEENDDLISHSICPECKEKTREEVKDDEIPIPR